MFVGAEDGKMNEDLNLFQLYVDVWQIFVHFH
jgi:hypothetical protein